MVDFDPARYGPSTPLNPIYRIGDELSRSIEKQERAHNPFILDLGEGQALAQLGRPTATSADTSPQVSHRAKVIPAFLVWLLCVTVYLVCEYLGWNEVSTRRDAAIQLIVALGWIVPAYHAYRAAREDGE